MNADTTQNALPHTGQPTSIAAAKTMVLLSIKTRLRILEHLVTLEPHGSTPDAAQHWLTLNHQSNSPRFVELADDKLIYDTGDQRPTRSNHPAIVYRPTLLGIQAISAGWYQGERLNTARRTSRIAVMRDALRVALQGWAANTKDPAQLAQIDSLEPLTKPSSRRRGP
jgi:hypothetical protein